MKILYLIIGFISFFLGSMGVILPVLPTTPFILLTAYCFARSSERFDTWLKQTKIYQFYVADYLETRSIPHQRKKKMALNFLILMGISIFFAPSLWLKAGLTFITISMLITLFFIVPTRD
ncbi:YbaN family protein [Eremococcus coleocola]|uniref:YbaN family protein n=1 Tax=Eremococcus coleocola TaxID=88132 RepID=UPI0004063D21|nr:YbaN family protein [Eremococcus coleocola]